MFRSITILAEKIPVGNPQQVAKIQI